MHVISKIAIKDGERVPREKIYESAVERVRAHYERQKKAGFINIRMAIPPEHKALWDKFKASHNLTQGPALCLLLDLFYDDGLNSVDGQDENSE